MSKTEAKAATQTLRQLAERLTRLAEAYQDAKQRTEEIDQLKTRRTELSEVVESMERVAVASESGGARLVVVGSDRFALNALLREDIGYDHSRDFILNTIGWLTQREALLGIRSREREHVKLVLGARQLTRMVWMCLAGMPGFAIALGILVLWRRRR